MSTRCMIGRLNKDSSVEAVYCHYDGYPKGVGDCLLHHYRLQELNELLQRGDMSDLGSTPDECSFYEDDQRPVFFESLEEYLTEGADHDYHYYFVPDENKWYVAELHWDTKHSRMSLRDKSDVHPLDEVLI